MKLDIFAIRDIKAQTYGNPSYFTYKGEAIRAFQDIMSNPNAPFIKHPEDYELFKLGSIDDNTGELIGMKMPEFIIKATDFANKKG